MKYKYSLITIFCLFVALQTQSVFGNIILVNENTTTNNTDSPFLIKPYLQNVTTDGITIMWESKEESPGEVFYSTNNSSYENKVTASVEKTNEDTYVNKAVINNLSPDSKYNYYTIQSEVMSAKQHFTTAPDNDHENFNVAIWGDSHYPNPWTKMTDYMITNIKPDLAFNTGDISNTGNKRSDLTTVFFPHICERIGSHIPFYSALGNHDVGSPWGGGKLIRQYHDQPKDVNSDPNGFKGSYLMTYSNVAFVFIDWNRMKTDIENNWFEQTLQSDTVQNARFRFVLIHAAPYLERWQDGEEPFVKENLPSIVEAYNVDAVFSGHTHAHERGVKNGVQYLTIGGGSYLDTNEKVGPIIYDHIIRGTNKEGNPDGFKKGLMNHFAELKIKDSTAEIKIHYFDKDGEHAGIVETITLNNSKSR